MAQTGPDRNIDNHGIFLSCAVNETVKQKSEIKDKGIDTCFIALLA